MITITVINASSLATRDEVLAAIASVQVQVHRDFAPHWRVEADIALLENGERPPTNAWWLVILDNSDLGAALGYHDLTPQGLPIGKVFVETSRMAGQDWTVSMSHEVLEMLSDPYAYLTAIGPTPGGPYLYAYENCDACQADQSGYKIGDRLVSNFCLPAWFDPWQRNTTGPFDFLNKINQPFGLLPGGYASVLGLYFYTGWQQIFAPGSPVTYSARPRVGSRRERRRTGMRLWLKSAVLTGNDFRVAKLIRPTLTGLQ